jgi:hypothetical protein
MGHRPEPVGQAEQLPEQRARVKREREAIPSQRSSEVIMNRVVHFEIPADNMERARRFYGENVGWKLNQLGPEMGIMP